MTTLRYKIGRALEMASDPRYLPFFLQRRFTRPSTREWIGNIVARRKPTPTYGGYINNHHAALLSENGIAHLGELLDAEQIAQIRAHFEQCLIADPYDPAAKPFLPLSADRPKSAHVAFHEAEDVLAAPHLLALANRPEILAIAEAFLGCRPTIGYIASWWSFATGEAAQAAENFHRDVDDWRFLKFFVYLSDVGTDEGPHIYVQASAKSERLLEIRRFDDSEVTNTFGNNAILVNTGEAGEGFLENTYGIHKGQPVERGFRVLFQVVYTLSTLPYAPRNPVGNYAEACKKTEMELDPYVNRLYLR